MNTETDNHLLLRWQRQRDARAFHEIANRHMAMVFATCRRVLRDAVEAEDLTQECFLQLAQYTRRPPDSLPAWLHVVAVRRSTSRLRSLGRRATREQRYVETQPAALEPGLNEVLAEVDEALAELPESLRAPLVLHFLEQRGQGEIAAELGVNQSTVSRRIDRGIAELRALLEQKHIVVTAGALAAGLSAEAGATVPATLGTALGKLSLGAGNAATAGAGISVAKLAGISGGILMKKAWAAAVGIVVLALAGYWVVSKDAASPAPPDVAAPVEVVENDAPAEDEPVTATAAPEAAPADSEEAEAVVATVETGGVIAGHVRDAGTGEGIADVRISATWDSETPTGGNDKNEASAVTDADGAYRLTGLAGQSGTRYKMARDTPEGYRRPTSMERKMVTLDESGSVSGADFTLHPEVPLSGTVVDSRDRPVDGASVTLAGGIDLYVAETTETDGSGRFSFHRLPPTGDLSIAARRGEAQASGPQTFTLPDEGITDLKLVLAETCAVSGVVVDSSGTALEGYTVHCLRVPQVRTGDPESGPSDRRGQFEVTGIAPGDYELVVFHSRPAGTGTNQKGYPITLESGQHLDGVTLVFGREFAIAGRVTNTAGEAIEGVSVQAVSSHYGGSDTESDATGHFRIDNLEDGNYQVDVGPAKGYQHMSLAGIPAGSEDLRVVLPGYFQVTGRVVDARTGQPIPEFEIALGANFTESLNAWLTSQFQTISNPEGKFELQQQSQLYQSKLAARAPGYATAVKALDLTGPPYKHEVELRLEPGQHLRGKVVDVGGAPIGGADVYWGKIQRVGGVGGDRTATKSAADGTFQLLSFPAGPQLISIYHPSYAPTWKIVEGTARFQPVEFVLTEGGIIEGTVTFAGGDDPLTCKAAATYPESHYIPGMITEVAAAGTFRIERVKPGETTVTLTVGSELPWQQRRRATQSIAVQAGYITEVHFNIQEYSGALEGAIRFPADAIPSRVQLTLESATESGSVKRLALAAPDGRFYFDQMPPGPAELSIDASFQNHRRIEAVVDAEIPENGTGYIEVQL